jgi:hypothetical protein
LDAHVDAAESGPKTDITAGSLRYWGILIYEYFAFHILNHGVDMSGSSVNLLETSVPVEDSGTAGIAGDAVNTATSVIDTPRGKDATRKTQLSVSTLFIPFPSYPTSADEC